MEQVKKETHYWCADTEQNGFLGQGVGVAVLDTGIAAHPDFDTRTACFKDIINKKKLIYDDNGHGTHVAGIIGGNGKLSRGIYGGMAPKCSFIIVKVLDGRGDGNIENVVKGIRWVRENRRRFNIRIVNISVGTLPHVGSEEERYLLKEVETLWDDGIVVVAAAGNYGPVRGSVTTPGISRKIITVGASDDEKEANVSGKTKRNYSGRGPTKECIIKPDLVAPGSGVNSCNAFYRRNARPYTVKSGTSMATPVVSGAVAVLLSKYPEMSNVEVKLKLRQSCVDLGLERNHQGWGMLNLKRLLEA